MTTIRRDGPTPAGGDYELTTYMDLATFTETDEESATGIIVSEWTNSGEMIAETVCRRETAPAAQPVP